MWHEVLTTDCLVALRGMDDNSVDSIVTDPPYELGFMGKSWDASGIAYNVEVWREAQRVLKPGGYMLAFSGSRTYHRMTCAIEDAGFEIRDQIMWVYGSGFPKSHNGEWGGTALKPAHEPICVARKPLEGTVAHNWAKWGTGALRIDECRIPTDAAVDDPRLGGKGSWSTGKAAANVYEGGYAGDNIASSVLGRWPANLVHDGSAEVIAAFPDAKGQQGDLKQQDHAVPAGAVFGQFGPKRAHSARAETEKSAARFFYCAKANKADRDEGLEGHEAQTVSDGRAVAADNAYQRGKTERKNTHPTVKPTELMRYLCRLVTPTGGLVLDPFAGSGSTGKAAALEGFSFLGFEQSEEYAEIARARIAAVAK